MLHRRYREERALARIDTDKECVVFIYVIFLEIVFESNIRDGFMQSLDILDGKYLHRRLICRVVWLIL